jgi:hypothetical protein
MLNILEYMSLCVHDVQVFIHDDHAGHDGWPGIQNQVVFYSFAHIQFRYCTFYFLTCS